ncbi:hypothetical protein U0070_011827, partial [Myodes glareolus]
MPTPTRPVPAPRLPEAEGERGPAWAAEARSRVESCGAGGVFYGISIFCLVALVRASLTDPGRLPENPKIPHAERELWELCNKCNLMRPKRSHHCSRCGHCVRRMDHHCPWINNCVGEDNHWLFLQLCFYTELLTCYALMFSFCHYYYFLPLKKRNL